MVLRVGVESRNRKSSDEGKDAGVTVVRCNWALWAATA